MIDGILKISFLLSSAQVDQARFPSSTTPRCTKRNHRHGGIVDMSELIDNARNGAFQPNAMLFHEIGQFRKFLSVTNGNVQKIGLGVLRKQHVGIVVSSFRLVVLLGSTIHGQFVVAPHTASIAMGPHIPSVQDLSVQFIHGFCGRLPFKVRKGMGVILGINAICRLSNACGPKFQVAGEIIGGRKIRAVVIVALKRGSSGVLVRRVLLGISKSWLPNIRSNNGALSLSGGFKVFGQYR
mmetsp:Transcript_1069/g.2946  ORF Transcript_1069/g.2946 Transcript_1069/m.2946 type:complete len:239 (+) Transcript_1069:605-1321(+)